MNVEVVFLLLAEVMSVPFALMTAFIVVVIVGMSIMLALANLFN